MHFVFQCNPLYRVTHGGIKNIKDRMREQLGNNMRFFSIYCLLILICDILIANGWCAPGWGGLDSVFIAIVMLPLAILVSLVYYWQKISKKIKSRYKLLETFFFINFLLILAIVLNFIIIFLIAEI